MENIELKNQLLDMFYEANSHFLNNNMETILFNVSERNLCSALGHEISKLLEGSQFSSYYSDVEYNRNGGKVKTIRNEELKIIDVTCDLIIHSRGKLQKDNLIAIEMKKTTATKKQMDADRERLRCLTKQHCDDVYSYDGKLLPTHVCKYELGIFYILDINHQMITLELYANSQLVNIEKHTFKYFSNYNK
ncbi:MAG: hypothetical protein NC182_04180 [Prevotella sp.]|nr:hypothetical protein [Staphylococcus sp.]MCM1350379.1 hypothetical protein [Prevotella sp.]